jgi:ADP-heptose:LPS heptosyltransferase
MGNRVKVKETGLEYNSVIFSPLFSDLESKNPDVIINLCWFPRECEIKENVLNLSIFNN